MKRFSRDLNLPTICRVGIKPGFYHKALPGGFYKFMRAGFKGFMWVYKSESLS